MGLHEFTLDQYLFHAGGLWKRRPPHIAKCQVIKAIGQKDTAES